MVIDGKYCVKESVGKSLRALRPFPKKPDALLDQLGIFLIAAELPGEEAEHFGSVVRADQYLLLQVLFMLGVLFEIVAPERHEVIAGLALPGRIDHEAIIPHPGVSGQLL